MQLDPSDLSGFAQVVYEYAVQYAPRVVGAIIFLFLASIAAG